MRGKGELISPRGAAGFEAFPDTPHPGLRGVVGREGAGEPRGRLFVSVCLFAVWALLYFDQAWLLALGLIDLRGGHWRPSRETSALADCGENNDRIGETNVESKHSLPPHPPPSPPRRVFTRRWGCDLPRDLEVSGRAELAASDTPGVRGGGLGVCRRGWKPREAPDPLPLTLSQPPATA